MTEQRVQPVVEGDGSIHIPAELLEAAGMCPGTELDIMLTEHGVSITRVADRDPEQAWFWTPEWQAGELEVTINHRNKVPGTIYMSDEELVAALDARMKPA